MHQLLGKVHASTGSRHQCGAVAEHCGRLSGVRPADHSTGSDGPAERGTVCQHGPEYHRPARRDLRQGSRHVYTFGGSDLPASDFTWRSVGYGRDIPQYLRRIGQDGLPDDTADG